MIPLSVACKSPDVVPKSICSLVVQLKYSEPSEEAAAPAAAAPTTSTAAAQRKEEFSMESIFSGIKQFPDILKLEGKLFQ